MNRPTIAVTCCVLAALYALPAHAESGLGTPVSQHSYEASGLTERSVAISGSSLAVGAHLNSDQGPGRGAAFVSRLDVPSSPPVALTPALHQDHDWFGYSIDVALDRVVVGAPTSYNSGRVGYAVLFDAGTGEELHRLAPDDGAPNDRFGEVVVIDGGHVLVTSLADADHGAWTGAVYVFDAASGKQLRKIVPDDGASHDHFGIAVALSGSIAAIGASGVDASGDSNGAVYIYDITTGTLITRLLHESPGVRDHFGRAVAITGRYVIATTQHIEKFGNPTGSACVFDRTDWNQIRTLRPLPTALDHFGASVSATDAVLMVGAPDTGAPFDKEGAVYYYDLNTGHQIHLTPGPAEEQEAQFGTAVALNAMHAVIAPRQHHEGGEESGVVHQYDGTVSCQFDYDGNERVDIYDLFELFSTWGPPSGHRGDLDDNGEVDYFDLIQLLLAWGDC